jgi:aminoglycoside phosphotransferase (APT) family kinase protein
VNIPDRHVVALRAVAQRFGLDGRAFEPLSGGSRNHVYRVGRPPQAVAVRVAGEGDVQLGVFRESEVLAQRAAAAHGLAPRVIHVSLAEGVLVDDWVAGSPWTRAEARSPESIRRVAQWLQALHSVPPPAQLQRVDFLGSLLHYCALLPATRVPASLLAEAQAWRGQLGEPLRAVLCHHDLHHANILDTGEAILAVDWEYAGLGDPIMDLAGFAAYQQLDAQGAQALVGAYGESRRINLERLAIARQLFEAVARVWADVLALCGATKKQS